MGKKHSNPEPPNKGFRPPLSIPIARFKNRTNDKIGNKQPRFHDTRRTALTRLSKKLDALELERVSGHKDLRILLDTYYQPTIEDLAGKLD